MFCFFYPDTVVDPKWGETGVCPPKFWSTIFNNNNNNKKQNKNKNPILY